MLAAQADSAPVLIHGGSGTGKGAIARWIHENSPRAGRPLVIADRKKPIVSQIPLAQGGTLLIDEIGEYPLGEQKILLGFLKTRSISHPEGGSKMPMLLNVRIMTSTSQSLDSRAQGGLFNPELLEKLNVFRIEMPALSKREEEFEDIALGIMNEIAHELQKDHLRGIAADAMATLRGYEWPGNLRELRNVLRMAVISAKGDQLETADLPNFGHDRIDFRATREQFEKMYILELLQIYDWQIDKTCQMTRIDKATLLSKIQRYGIEPSGPSIS